MALSATAPAASRPQSLPHEMPRRGEPSGASLAAAAMRCLPIGLFCLHLVRALWRWREYPYRPYDPDLLAYFVYWKNLVTGIHALRGVPYFTVPKPLLVFLLGPLDDPRLAFALSASAAAALGTLVYLIGRRAFGAAAGTVASLALLLDIQGATLTLGSNADLYLTVFLFASVYCAMGRRYVASACCLTLAALVKPVVLPCALYFLTVEGRDRRRAAWSSLVPLAALPLTLGSNRVLLGSYFGVERFFTAFDAMSARAPLATPELLRVALWLQLVKDTFVSTAPWGFVGLAAWLARDKARLTSPLILMPLLLLGGYLLLNVKTPFVPFFRFFWPLEVWFLAFVVFGMLETIRHAIRRPRLVRFLTVAVLLAFLADDLVSREMRYTRGFADPMEKATEFAINAFGTLERERLPGQTVLAPLAFFPHALWALQDTRVHPEKVVVAEQAADAASPAQPDWVLYVPQAFLKPATKEYVDALLASGSYRLVTGAPEAALFTRAEGG